MTPLHWPLALHCSIMATHMCSYLSLFLHCDRRVAHTLWYHCHCLCSFSVQVWRHQNLDAAVQA